MSKRKAATDLNHDNWDREEEPEIPGKFREASKEVVQDRIIRTAKRRLKAGESTSPGGEESNEAKKIFSGFSGFGSVNSLSNPTSISEIAKNSFSFLKKSDNLKTVSSETKNSDKKLTTETDENYLAKLKGLNEAVLDWIKQHVESNPCCILTPIFRDYDEYLKEIQSEKKKSSSTPMNVQKTNLSGFLFDVKDSKPSTNTSNLGSSNNTNTKSIPAKPSFSFGSDESSKKSSVPTFSFPSKDASSKLSIPSTLETNKNISDKLTNQPFSFASKDSSEKSPSSLFMFGASNNDTSKATPFFGLIKNDDKNTTGFTGKQINIPGIISTENAKLNSFTSPQSGGISFSSLNKPSESRGNNDAEAEDDSEEPQPEPIKPVTEEGAIFTQRVKMFIKKGENYSDLGVGNLFIKEAPNGWHQAIVRHDTSIGNIILNILLSSQQPTKRLGKNNVMIVCQPTPQHTGAAVPVLLRVKTSGDADKLLEIIEKYKKK